MSDRTPSPDLWTNHAARRTVLLDFRTPCPQCNGGEYWECGRCLGSGWEPVAEVAYEGRPIRPTP